METPAEIDPVAARSALEGGAALLDVRERNEYAEAHIPGSVLIPLGELPDRLAELPAGSPLLVYCRSGVRSAQAVEWLRGTRRRPDAVNVAGGILRWAEEGLPVR